MRYSFDTNLASEIGLIEAIVLERFYTEIRKNRVNLGIRYYEISRSDFYNDFNFIPLKKASNALNKLVHNGILDAEISSDEIIYRFYFTEKAYKLFEKRETKCQQLGSIGTKIML